MLEGLYRGALEDALAREERVSLDELYRLVDRRPPARDARAALTPRGAVHVIAEIKRRSPSKGALSDIPDAGDLARQYQSGGASAVSVLTEQRGFGGSLQDLQNVSDAIELPVLRKDFLQSEYQIVEARAHGADWVLLIMAGLDDGAVKSLREVAAGLGMAALVETHSAAEVERALECGAEIIGVNARDLTTFELDPSLFGRLAPMIPAGVIRVAESAVGNSQDVARYRDDGAHAVLVGEALVTGADPAARIKEFIGT